MEPLDLYLNNIKSLEQLKEAEKWLKAKGLNVSACLWDYVANTGWIRLEP